MIGSKFQSLLILSMFLSCLQNICLGENQIIDSLEVLESLSEIALLRHHPQSAFSSNDNVTERFAALLQDLHNQNLTLDHQSLNCSQYSLLPKNLCNGGTFSECLSASDMLELVPQSTKSVSEALARLCPLILLQLHNSACSAPPSTNETTSHRPSSLAVWGYGLLFVTIISCCSLCGVLILPLLSKDIYQIVLMLFEGLAVGSLVGSSLFHLIPQTFRLVGQDKEHSYLWRSLLIFGGIYLFYVSERFMKIIIDLKKAKKAKRNETSNEFLKAQPGDVHNATISQAKKENGAYTNGNLQVLSTDGLGNGSYRLVGDTEENKVVKSYPVDNEVANTIHSHHHDHGIEFEKGKSAIATVAWMIIFGDGLHNFIDGLSIGAAFSESILAGISISVAVICEEFPHELGDFAVLLSAGMTTRQALLYNFLSAITCYLGLVMGILLGDLAEGAPYIFALAAGMFLYIALVDMLGELNEALQEARQKGVKKELKVFLIQNIGILIGVVLLFVMARYAEHFNFENLGGIITEQEETIDDQVKQLYSSLQETTTLQNVLIS